MLKRSDVNVAEIDGMYVLGRSPASVVLPSGVSNAGGRTALSASEGDAEIGELRRRCCLRHCLTMNSGCSISAGVKWGMIGWSIISSAVSWSGESARKRASEAELDEVCG